MSSDIALRVNDLAKCYQIYSKPRDRLMQMFAGRRRQFFKEFWALKNVSFEIRKGETVGIIGRNGSGKSTLLQMICGTLNPTAGSISTNGRIAALLELGAGFNPEFSGLENVYLNAAVLGLTKEETDHRLESILRFAEIGEFIDQPVKTYSSGMLVRLAFSVAINVDPQILIVDEALSVGDELFQRKCFSRIEAIKQSGATILFVSHSAAAIVDLCDRAILLDAGELIASGVPKQIVGNYQKLLYAPADQRAEIRSRIQSGLSSVADKIGVEIDENPPGKSETDEVFDPGLRPSSTIEYSSNGAEIEAPGIYTHSGRRVNNLIGGRRYVYRYDVRFNTTATNVRFGMLIKTITGTEIGGAHSANRAHEGLPIAKAGEVYAVSFEFDCRLNPGVYFLNAGVLGAITEEDIYLHRLLDIDMFRVLPDASSLATSIVDLNCLPSIEHLS
ncbi:ABC transporter ATP-binding protein [Rhizobium sp. BK538]|uniref:ABC transporter ATP-binding protein n=1 Tax=Rhizobium sp. BK538 TaxID=2586984 RepID=UPI001611ACB3|nr:ABC transporter ATP-binding protein [Rhizobium sp. BK538]MBB4167367.1 lipopolysaccharide transport system ATP-binding protein [Rhizobium sp. BK538]